MACPKLAYAFSLIKHLKYLTIYATFCLGKEFFSINNFSNIKKKDT